MKNKIKKFLPKNKNAHTNQPQTLDEVIQNFANDEQKMNAIFNQCAEKNFAYIQLTCPEAAKNVKNAPYARCTDTVKNGSGYKDLITKIEAANCTATISVHPTMINISVRPKPKPPQ
jgi:hypothetical protein